MKLVVRVCILTWVWRGKEAEPAGAVCPMQRRAAEASATYGGTAMSVCFIFKRMAVASSRSFCISTDRTYGLFSMSFRLISGSNMAVNLHIKMAAFSQLASSMWHLSSIVTQAGHSCESRYFLTSAAHQDHWEISHPRPIKPRGSSDGGTQLLKFLHMISK